MTLENQDEILVTLQNLDSILGVTLEQCTAHEHSVACLRYDTNALKAREVVKMVNDQTSYTAHYHAFNNSLDALNRKKEILHYRNMTIIAFAFAIPTFLIAMVFGTSFIALFFFFRVFSLSRNDNANRYGFNDRDRARSLLQGFDVMDFGHACSILGRKSFLCK